MSGYEDVLNGLAAKTRQLLAKNAIPLAQTKDRSGPSVSPAPACPPVLSERPPGASGTDVTVRAFPVRQTNGKADHMYVEFNDGQRRVIARGGPTHNDFGGAAGDVLSGALRVHADVGPAEANRDNGRGGRVMFRGFLPDETADQASARAREHQRGVNRNGNSYTRNSNSNSYAGDVVEDRFHCRVGDDRTWGYRTRLGEDEGAPPYDLSKALTSW